jgi:GTP-binding protein YchF
MALKCGIVGLPNVGKSTLFNCLSSAKAQSANFPFCTIEPNVGIITVPDERLNKLSDLVNPERIMPTTVEIVDIAGLVKGASKGEGLGNQFLGNIRECNAIIHVLRCFDDGNIIHVDGSVDPVRDKDVIDMELQLKDLEAVEKRLDKAKKAARTGDKEAVKMLSIIEKYQSHLESGKSIRSLEMDEESMKLVGDMQLLTEKPVLYVCNVDEDSAVSGNNHTKAVEELVKDEDCEVMYLCAGMESDISELETFEEKQMFLEELGLEEPGVSYLIKKAYKLLDLETYFTAGVKEVRAWTIDAGMKAPQAAGVIHTDFEKGFIRAEVIKYVDFVELGSEAACREKGKLNVEGKEYVVQDGDVMHFRFNV